MGGGGGSVDEELVRALINEVLDVKLEDYDLKVKDLISEA